MNFIRGKSIKENLSIGLNHKIDKIITGLNNILINIDYMFEISKKKHKSLKTPLIIIKNDRYTRRNNPERSNNEFFKVIIDLNHGLISSSFWKDDYDWVSHKYKGNFEKILFIKKIKSEDPKKLSYDITTMMEHSIIKSYKNDFLLGN